MPCHTWLIYRPRASGNSPLLAGPPQIAHPGCRAPSTTPCAHGMPDTVLQGRFMTPRHTLPHVRNRHAGHPC